MDRTYEEKLVAISRQRAEVLDQDFFVLFEISQRNGPLKRSKVFLKQLDQWMESMDRMVEEVILDEYRLGIFHRYRKYIRILVLIYSLSEDDQKIVPHPISY